MHNNPRNLPWNILLHDQLCTNAVCEHFFSNQSSVVEIVNNGMSGEIAILWIAKLVSLTLTNWVQLVR